MTVLYVLDVDDFRPLAEVAAREPGVTVRRRGPYYEVSSNGPIRIDRNATGCRNAVWYSSVAAVRGGSVGRWDKTELRIEPHIGQPAEASAGSQASDWSPTVPPGP